MEKRGIILSAAEWRALRDLRNSIAHDYLVEGSDKALHESYAKTPVLIQTAENLIKYARQKGCVS